MSPGRGVWVTGPSRSGTSMVAGLLARHGVFFGDCIDPNRYNPRGFFESRYMKRVFRDGAPDDWPEAWTRNLEAEGIFEGQPWGIKCGPERADFVLDLEPEVIVLCLRPLGQIKASRRRVHWARGKAEAVVRSAWARMDRIRKTRPDVCVRVHTDELVRGRKDQVSDALDRLGLDFSQAIAADWIDPSLWNRNL